jgi:hypothetical protein
MEVKMSLQITLFQAPRAVRINQNEAERVVQELDNHIRTKITDATSGIERQLRIQNALVFFLAAMASLATAIGAYLAAINK